MFVCIIFIALLVIWYKNTVKKLVVLDAEGIELKKSNLKWGCAEAVVYGFFIELIMLFWVCDGTLMGFALYCTMFFIPVYIVIIIVTLFIYHMRKRILK